MHANSIKIERLILVESFNNNRSKQSAVSSSMIVTHLEQVRRNAEAKQFFRQETKQQIYKSEYTFIADHSGLAVTCSVGFYENKCHCGQLFLF